LFVESVGYDVDLDRTGEEIHIKVESSGAYGWPRLSKAQQEEVNGAIVMFEAAIDQGHAQAGHVLGCMYQMGQGVYAT
jgi:hypothetical protein